MALEELTASIRDTVAQRVRSPLWGTLIAAWLVRNWRLVVMLFFGDVDPSIRLKLIDDAGLAKLPQSQRALIWDPLFASCAIVVVVPFVSRVAAVVWAWHQKKMREAQERHDGVPRLSLEESMSLQREHSAVLARHQQQTEVAWRQLEKVQQRLQISEAAVEDLETELGRIEADRETEREHHRVVLDRHADIVREVNALRAENFAIANATSRAQDRVGAPATTSANIERLAEYVRSDASVYSVLHSLSLETDGVDEIEETPQVMGLAQRGLIVVTSTLHGTHAAELTNAGRDVLECVETMRTDSTLARKDDEPPSSDSQLLQGLDDQSPNRDGSL